MEERRIRPEDLRPPDADWADDHESSWIDGRIPWSTAGLVEAFSELASALDPVHPGDADEFGGPEAPDPAERHVLWFLDRYGDRDGRAHALRFYLARRFLIQHCAGLVRAGLLRQVTAARGPHDPGPGHAVSITVTAGLTRALATLPFSVHMDDPDGEPCDRAFDPAEVVRAARAFDARGAGN